MEKPSGIRLCDVDGCNRKHLAKGFCMKHYQINRINSMPEVRTKLRQYAKKYFARPEVKERNLERLKTKRLSKAIKDLSEKDPHEMCKKLGQTMAHSRRNPDYFYRCTKCGVSYSDKEKIHFYKENKCPCCHLMLRMRKTIQQKRNISI